MQTAISFGTTVIGAFLGRKTFSAATLGRASTAARGVSRSMKESSDVARAQESVSAVQSQIQELDASLQTEIAGIEASHAASNEPLTTLSIKPKRAGIQVQLVALTWMPRDKV
jgi:hypothetical protein